MGKKKREVQEVNASSTADIAFLLLVFFLVTTSMSTDKGLSRVLPPPLPDDLEQPEIKVKERNVLTVLVNSRNQLLVNGEVMEVSRLKDKAKDFILNKTNSPDLPEIVVEDFGKGFGPIAYTKNHVISLQNDRGTKYEAYIGVQNALVAAYDEIRDEYCLPKFGRRFVDLDETNQEVVKKFYPMKISEAEPKDYSNVQ